MDVNEVVEGLTKFFDGPGRGRKQCMECKRYVGVRVPLCPCGFDFANYVKVAERPVELTEEQQRDREIAFRLGFARCTIIAIPAGPPLIKYMNDMELFCTANIEAGRGERKFYSPAALKHWLRYYVANNDRPFDTLAKEFDVWLSNLCKEWKYDESSDN